MTDQLIRVLVVDDTVIYRKIISDILAEDTSMTVVGTAVNGKIALQKIEQLRPDIVTLDLEMPELDGIGVLRALREHKSKVGVIMLSAFTTQGAQATVESLELGAFDFVVKPTADSVNESREILKKDLIQKIKGFARTKQVRDILSDKSTTGKTGGSPAETATRVSAPVIPAKPKNILKNLTRPKIVVLGISTGGPQSLVQMIPKLPVDLNLPVMIVQHMPPLFTKSLADDLNRRCDWTVVEAENNQLIEKRYIYIAPGGKQMKIVRKDEENVIVITDDPPENNCKPAVDYLFRSAAHTYGASTLGVIMTGMGSDGTLGCKLLSRMGASIIAQDQASCVVYGMPRQVVEEGIADVVAPLDQIADQIARLIREGLVLCK